MILNLDGVLIYLISAQSIVSVMPFFNHCACLCFLHRYLIRPSSLSPKPTPLTDKRQQAISIQRAESDKDIAKTDESDPQTPTLVINDSNYNDAENVTIDLSGTKYNG